MSKEERKEVLSKLILKQEQEIRTLVPLMNDLKGQLGKMTFRYQELINKSMSNKRELFILEGKLQVIRPGASAKSIIAEKEKGLRKALSTLTESERITLLSKLTEKG